MREQIVEIVHNNGTDEYKWKDQVVRCTRCQEWHPREATSYGFCIRWGQYTKESDYCSYGK